MRDQWQAEGLPGAEHPRFGIVEDYHGHRADGIKRLPAPELPPIELKPRAHRGKNLA